MEKLLESSGSLHDVIRRELMIKKLNSLFELQTENSFRSKQENVISPKEKEVIVIK